MTPGAELGDILPPPAALQGPWETPTGLELWASPGSRTQEALQQLGASSNLSHPLPPGCSGFQQVSFEELNSGASPPRECALCSPVCIQGLARGEVGGVTQRTHLATRTSAR